MFLTDVCRYQQYETHLCLHVRCPVFFPILTKLGVSRKIFIKVSNTKFHENPFGGSRPEICRETDKQTEGHDEINGRFSRFMRPRLPCSIENGINELMSPCSVRYIWP
jgi:hypothetical protein